MDCGASLIGWEAHHKHVLAVARESQGPYEDVLIRHQPDKHLECCGYSMARSFPKCSRTGREHGTTAVPRNVQVAGLLQH